RKIGPVTDSAQVRVFLPFTPPDLTIVKSADATEAAPGQTVVYTLTYSNVGKGAATDFTIVDDFDERYVTITDAGGGTVAGGKITWQIAGPLYAGESGSISYTVRISDTMPSGTTNIDNVVVITHPDDPNPDNNRDDWRVVVAFLPFTEPFLPFTGGEMWVLLYVGVALAAAGVLFRRLGNQEA
ncbi:MAG: hypothetical protein C0418_01205, partial [Coriobacteriaceae bacterium]|nr:hypothetical protein [Coriobacteriaceae bacterium]